MAFLEKLGDIFGNIWDVTKSLANGLEKAASNTEKALGGILEYFEREWKGYDDAMVQLARQAGLSEERYKALSKEYLQISTNIDSTGMNFIQKYGKSTSDMVTLANDFQKTIGRNISLTEDQLGKYAALDEVLQGAGTKIAQQFLNFGMNISSTEKVMSQIMTQSVEDGVRLDKVTSNIQDKMSEFASYTFENGIQGFTAMAEKAAKVNISMQEAFKFADKIGDISKSIEVASNLQVLGGSFASLSNPLEMYYEATSDMGALQDRMVSMFKDLGTFNKETNQVEMSRFNRMRVKEAASQMGISAEEVFKMINTSAMKDEIMNQIGNSNGLNDRQREFLANTATINDNGKAVVQYNGQEREVSSLRADEVKALQGLSNTGVTAQSINQIAMDVHTIAENKAAGEYAKSAEAQMDFNKNAGDVVRGMGQYLQEVFQSVGGILGGEGLGSILNKIGTGAGTIANWAGNTIGGWSDKISNGLGSLFTDISENVQESVAKQGNLTAQQRSQMNALAGSLRGASQMLAQGSSLQEIDKYVHQRVIASPTIAKGGEVLDILKIVTNNGKVQTEDEALKSAWENWAKSKGSGNGTATKETGGLIVTPHETGGWMLPNLEEGGILTGGIHGVETPIATVAHNDGSVLTETAQPNEFVVREQATMNSFGAINTINSNPDKSFAAVEVKKHEDGGETGISPNAQQNVKIAETPGSVAQPMASTVTGPIEHIVSGKIDVGSGELNVRVENDTKNIKIPMDEIKSFIQNYIDNKMAELGSRIRSSNI